MSAIGAAAPGEGAPGAGAPVRIAPDAGDPAGRARWLLRGPAVPVPPGRAWDLIRRSLAAEPERVRLWEGDLALTGGALLGGVEALRALPLSGRVGVHVGRSACLVELVLAIWAQGGVYVPLASEHPAARLAETAARCALDLVLTEGDGTAFGGCAASTAVTVRGRALRALRPPQETGPAGRPGGCYVAHTSGSSGAPKSVLVGDAALMNRLAAMREIARPTADDTVLLKTSLAFDVHLWELAFPLAFGCRIAVHPQEPHLDPRAIARLMVERRVTIAGFVPSLLALLPDRAALVREHSLRLVFCGGEAWPPALAARFLSAFPGVELRNSYGPAETTLAVSNAPVGPDPVRAIELGAPLLNTAFLVEEREREGDRVVGPLTIGGAQVAEGYLPPRGGPAAPSPFGTARIGDETMRVYATGDLVALDTATGALRFRGREDDQVKLHGVRISLAEVEATIAALPGIEACAAAVLASGSGDALWAAYTVRPGASVAPLAIREGCARSLPATHVPTRLREVAGFALGPSGKVDRARLARRLASEG